MWVVSVLPIGKAAAHKEFSYWSAEERKEGAVVKLPARGAGNKKESYGLVMSCSALADMKQRVRSSRFTLKKIQGESAHALSREFLRAVFPIADFHASSAGAVIADLVPSAILQAAAPAVKIDRASQPKKNAAESEPETKSIVGSRDARAASYVALAKKTILAKKSVLIIAPTIVEAERLAAYFTSEFPGAFLFHSGLSKKEMRRAWSEIAGRSEPAVIIGTPLALSSPRRDLGAIVLERAGAQGYARQERPYLDIRTCAQILAEHMEARFYLGAPAPLIFKEPEASSGPQKSAENFAAGVSIIDTRRKKEEIEEKKPFEIFSFAARMQIEMGLRSHKNILLLCARRGLATQTVCDDCGSTFCCSVCGSVLVLQSAPDIKSGRIFRCFFCGEEVLSHVACRTCGGWRLSTLGIGLDRVVAEGATLFPDTPFLLADEKILKDGNRVAQMADEFARAQGTLLAATEGILPYLNEPTAYAIVASVDSFLLSPEYSAAERTYQMLSEMRGLVRETMLVQTRLPEAPALQALAENRSDIFLHSDQKARKKFLYPPFSVLVRLSVSGPAARVKVERDTLFKHLLPWKPQMFPGRPLRRTHAREHIVVRVPAREWPERRLLAYLRSLGPSVEVRVNPRSLFGD